MEQKNIIYFLAFQLNLIYYFVKCLEIHVLINPYVVGYLERAYSAYQEKTGQAAL